MSRSYISTELRRLVVVRAEHRCEYCLIHEEDTFFGCEVDHIVSEKHGGATEAGNLAYACVVCNRRKGSDVGSLVPGTTRISRFYNPRPDRWGEHFRLSADGISVDPLTDVAVVTARVFGFNDIERQLEREALRELGRYPPSGALRRLSDP